MTGAGEALPPDELRALIRGVLRDLLPAVIDRAPSRFPPATAVPPPPAGSPPATPPPTAPPHGVPAGTPHIASVPRIASASSDSGLRQSDNAQPTGNGRPTGSDSSVGGGRPTPPPARAVRLETDADLRQFALEILRLADNPARRRDLLTGRLTFTLAGRAGHTSATGDRQTTGDGQRTSDGQAPGERRIETGAVTERAVQTAARAGQRLVLGPRAVLTPLARDRALALGVPIEKER